ncbi:calcium/calmodulin-dependent protein kinase type IV-like isoform X1 [Ostrea edulis]|uniref:calcium/calmodulin-dependent protein kinase type IV-like isoform X1 n=1 Tax=Ostrea edulis TaxID=37623 RepID=UPI002095B8E1|nr:calcium/calmodulin-dependent protein kinase type IV-like isoform X1 [Ostrea edulis]
MPREVKQDYWISESIKDNKFEDYYTQLTELGRGATSVVYKCEHKGTTKKWAVKIIHKRVDKKVINTEIGILLKLNHKNVIRLKEIFETPTNICLVLELVKGGELFDRIVSRGYYSEKDASTAVRQMLIAVKYLHENEVVHRDLKPENLLYEDLTDESNLKVADFGLSKIIDREVTMNTVCGTPGYCAPEVLAGKRYSYPVDMWSIGVITYILLCGYEPFYSGENEAEMYKKILKADYKFDPPFWNNISENAKDFVKKMLLLDPKKRLTENQALNHDWVKGLAAKSDHMPETHNKIKEFNATRKMKAITDATLLASRAARITSILNQKQSLSDVSMQSVSEPMEH